MLKKSVLPLALGFLMAATVACAQDTPPPENAGAHHGPPTAEEVIARLDTDKDGVISKAEAAANPRMAEHFDTIDTDHDGKLTAAELTAFFATMHHRRQ